MSIRKLPDSRIRLEILSLLSAHQPPDFNSSDMDFSKSGSEICPHALPNPLGRIPAIRKRAYRVSL